MAQLYFEGFELGMPPDWTQTGGTLTTTGPTAFGSGASLGSTGSILTKSIPATTDLYIGFRYSASVANTNVNTPVVRLQGDAGAVNHLQIWWSAANTLALGRGTTSIATAAVNEPAAGAWSFIEIRCTIADSGGRCVVRIDGQTVIDFTGDTKNGGTNSSIDNLQFHSPGASVFRYLDDLYINDATGVAPHNTFYGPCRVYSLAPTGAGTDTQFTSSGGANWSCVDEQPASAADYVTASVVGTRDTYTIADLPGTVTTVYGVRQTAIAKSTDASAVSLKTATRSGGNLYTGTPVALGPSDSVASAIRSVDPATGAAWTVAGVNAVEAGFEVA